MGNSRLLTRSLLILILAIFIQHSSSSALPGLEPKEERVAEKELIEGDDSGDPGGLGPVKPADERSRGMIYSLALRYGICTQGTAGNVCGSGTPSLDVVSYRTQVVNGLMYFVKVQYGKVYWHVKIHEQPPTNELTLEGVQGPKSIDDPILYFA